MYTYSVILLLAEDVGSGSATTGPGTTDLWWATASESISELNIYYSAEINHILYSYSSLVSSSPTSSSKIATCTDRLYNSFPKYNVKISKTKNVTPNDETTYGTFWYINWHSVAVCH